MLGNITTTTSHTKMRTNLTYLFGCVLQHTIYIFIKIHFRFQKEFLFIFTIFLNVIFVVSPFEHK